MKTKTNNYSDSKEFSDKFESTELDIHGVRLPEFQIDLASKRHLGISEDSSNYDFLRALALNGFKTLNINKSDENYKKYVDRAKHELDTLKELGFIDYILLSLTIICNYAGMHSKGRGGSGKLYG
jgi:DNA polymerase III alpha subunit